MKPAVAQVYFAPSFLDGVITDAQYRTWLTRKAKYIIAEDRERRRPCVKGATARLYKELIHKAVCEAGQFDPFTGAALQWELVCTWDDTTDKNIDEATFRRFALLPTVDHVDPCSEDIRFEICSWLVNRSKNNLTADEYVALCGKIVAYLESKSAAAAKRSTRQRLIPRSPQKYFLPKFLAGVITEAAYLRWLRRKSSHLYHSDVNEKRNCAKNSTARLYKALIHQAILDNGLLDPFTGDALRYDLLSEWDDSLTKNPDRAIIEKYALLPTVDHTDPMASEPAFEICSWLINRCKADLTPDEFFALCRRILAFRNV
jgi:hypothetical protein